MTGFAWSRFKGSSCGSRGFCFSRELTMTRHCLLWRICLSLFPFFLLSDMGIAVRIVQKDPLASDVVWLVCSAIVHRLGVLLPCDIFPHMFL